MDVILLERVERLGQIGDVVKVKDGYARNYLLPQKKALPATAEARKRFEAERAQLEADNLNHRREAEAVAEKMGGLSVVMVQQAGDTGQLYGSVTARDIAAAVTEAGFTIERRQVVRDRGIKTLGLHPVRIRLHPEVSVEITANVARSEEEAKLQAAGLDVGAERAEEAAAMPAAGEIFDQTPEDLAQREARDGEASDGAAADSPDSATPRPTDETPPPAS